MNIATATIARLAALTVLGWLTVALSPVVHAQEYSFTTVAGGFTGDGGLATDANVGQPTGMAFDAYGNLYVAEFNRHRIRKVSPTGLITTVAGTGAAGYSANVNKAGHATMNRPMAIAIDSTGNIYFADSNNHRIRKIMPGGVITTVAGTGAAVSSGDGGPAISAGIYRPTGLTFDVAGNLYVSELFSHRVRRITPAGVISTFAGNGVGTFGGDGGPATVASLREPTGLAVDGAGNLYIADSRNNRIRKVAPSGVISTAVGAGSGVSLGLALPQSVAVDPAGSIYIGDASCVLYKVAAGTFSLVAGGDGSCTYNGDGIRATSATIDFVEGLAVAANGDLHFTDSGQYRVRRIDGGGTISTIAGIGSLREGPSTQAVLSVTLGLGVGDGNVYVADAYPNLRVRKIAPGGDVSTLAGNGVFQSSGNGGPASSASLAYPYDAAVDVTGNVYITENFGNVVRKVSTSGTITAIAGTGAAGFSGDGGPAISARLSRPTASAVDTAGNLFIADQNNHRVRKVTPDGTISTVAGNGASGFAGDGGLATEASVAAPQAVAVDAAGNLYIATGLRVRKVTPGGIISTVAGNGTSGYGGDGGAATQAQLIASSGIAIDASGNLFIAGGGLRKVAPNGIISTVQGLTMSAYDVAVDANGALFVSVVGGRVLRGTITIPTRKSF